MYNYQGSAVQQERLARGTDHCGSEGNVFDLKELVSAGVVVDPRDREQPLTVGTSPTGTSVLIYAVNADFDIHVAFDGMRGHSNAIKHETLFHNADVRAAGELKVREGIIVTVNDHSGSYRTAGKLDTDRRFAEAVLTALERVVAPLDDAERRRLRRSAGRRRRP